MSPTKNKAIVRRVISEVINEGRLPIVDEVFAQEHIYHNLPPGLPSGRAGLKAFLNGIRSGFPDIHHTILEQIAEGDKVVTLVSMQGTHHEEFMGVPPSGKRVNINGMFIVRIEGDQIIESWAQFDDLALLRQVGALPS